MNLHDNLSDGTIGQRQPIFPQCSFPFFLSIRTPIVLGHTDAGIKTILLRIPGCWEEPHDKFCLKTYKLTCCV